MRPVFLRDGQRFQGDCGTLRTRKRPCQFRCMRFDLLLMNDAQEQLVAEPRKVGYVWIVYLLLYALAVPWYWPAGYRGPLVLGFPLWVAVSLGAVLLLAAWTGFVIRRYWTEGEEAG